MAEFTVEQAIKDPNLKSHIQKYITAYEKRALPRNKDGKIITGLRFRRQPEDTLIAQGLFNPNDLLDLFVQIMNKSCKLPSNQREVVSRYVTLAMKDLYIAYVKKN